MSETTGTADQPEPVSARWAIPLPILLALIAVVAVADSSVPPGLVVGVLLLVPVLLSATRPGRRDVLIVGTGAVVAKIVSDVLSGSSENPVPYWTANRTLAYLVVIGGIGLALLLQRMRLAEAQFRRQAVTALDLNRLLMSLLAHDLRAPLVVARQCIGYIEDSLDRGITPDLVLLAETGGRLDRSLRGIEIVLSVARAELSNHGSAGLTDVQRVRVREMLADEVAAFAPEGILQGKRVMSRVDELDGVELELNSQVVRQTLAILLDNAIRYAVPGEVTVRATVLPAALRVEVRDAGSRDPVRGGDRPSQGAGLGLELSRSLLAHVGGWLEHTTSENGSEWSFTVPAGVADGAERPSEARAG